MMLRRVRVKETGDTSFLMEEHVEKTIFERENEKVLGRGGQPAIAEPLLLGITKASLSTESFISASSSEETTKVLTEAAPRAVRRERRAGYGKLDELRGIEENVIMGRLLPAGTGLGAYKKLDLVVDDDQVTRGFDRDEPLAAASEE